MGFCFSPAPLVPRPRLVGNPGAGRSPARGSGREGGEGEREKKMEV